MKLIRYAYPAPSELERVFGALFPSSNRCGNALDTFEGGSWTGAPAANVYEDADNYRVQVELPGARKEDITVALENAELTVTATRKENGPDGDSSAEYRRSLTVPEGIDPAKVEAVYENGVLTVTLPKPASRKPRSITVK